MVVFKLIKEDEMDKIFLESLLLKYINSFKIFMCFYEIINIMEYFLRRE